MLFIFAFFAKTSGFVDIYIKKEEKSADAPTI
jgi:hypothetical protein